MQHLRTNFHRNTHNSIFPGSQWTSHVCMCLSSSLCTVCAALKYNRWEHFKIRWTLKVLVVTPTLVNNPGWTVCVCVCYKPIQVVEGVWVSDNGLHSKLLCHLDDGSIPLLPVRLWVIFKRQPGHFPLLQREREDLLAWQQGSSRVVPPLIMVIHQAFCNPARQCALF